MNCFDSKIPGLLTKSNGASEDGILIDIHLDNLNSIVFVPEAYTSSKDTVQFRITLMLNENAIAIFRIGSREVCRQRD